MHNIKKSLILSTLVISMLPFHSAKAQAEYAILEMTVQKEKDQKQAERESFIANQKTLSTDESYANFIVKLENARKTYLKIYGNKDKINFYQLIGTKLIYLDTNHPPVYQENVVKKDNINIILNQDNGFSLDNVNKTQCDLLIDIIRKNEYITSLKVNNMETKFDRSKIQNNSSSVYKCESLNQLDWK